MVSGHVDGVAEILSRRDFDGMAHFTFRAPAALAKFIAVKGSVALDGTSLTVNAVDGRQVRGSADPAHAGGDDAGRSQGGRQRQYRGRPDGALRGAADRGGTGRTFAAVTRRACARCSQPPEQSARRLRASPGGASGPIAPSAARPRPRAASSGAKCASRERFSPSTAPVRVAMSAAARAANSAPAPPRRRCRRPRPRPRAPLRRAPGRRAGRD